MLENRIKAFHPQKLCFVVYKATCRYLREDLTLAAPAVLNSTSSISCANKIFTLQYKTAAVPKQYPVQVFLYSI